MNKDGIEYSVSDRAERLGVSRVSFYRYTDAGMPHPAELWVQEGWLARNAKRWRKVEESGSDQYDDQPADLNDAEWNIKKPTTWLEAKQREDAIYRRQQTEIGRNEIISEEREEITREARVLLSHLQVTIRKHLCEGCQEAIANAIREAIGGDDEQGI